MADKSLGQVAYEKWVSELPEKYRAKAQSWDGLLNEFQAAWQSAAEAAAEVGRKQGIEEAAQFAEIYYSPLCAHQIRALKDKEAPHE